MKIFDAVDLVGCVHCEWNAVQGLAADYAGEAAWVVGSAGRTQDPVQDRAHAH